MQILCSISRNDGKVARDISPQSWGGVAEEAIMRS